MSPSTRQLHVDIPEASFQGFCSLVNRLNLVLQGVLVLQQATSPVDFCGQPEVLKVFQYFSDLWDERGVLVELLE